MWKACGQMKQAKLAYKNAIKAYQRADNLYISNDLNECLLKKDMVNFWKTWNAKSPPAKPSSVIDGVTDESIIAQKFSTFFRQANHVGDNTCHRVNKLTTELQQHIGAANLSKLKLLDVDTGQTRLVMTGQTSVLVMAGCLTGHRLERP